MGTKKQEPKIMRHTLTNEYFYVDKYKDLGNGRFEAISKRKASEKEIEEYKAQLKNQEKRNQNECRNK